MFWRKYVTTNEAVSCATLLHSIQDFLVHYLAVDKAEVDVLLSLSNQDLLVATVDSTGDGMVGEGVSCFVVKFAACCMLGTAWLALGWGRSQ